MMDEKQFWDKLKQCALTLKSENEQKLKNECSMHQKLKMEAALYF